MNDIHKWLESDRDYDQGVQLYLEHGQNSVYKGLFQQARSSFTEKKLLELLQEIAGESQSDQSPDPEVKEEKKEQHPPKILGMIRRRSVLHSESFQMKARSERHKVALEILAIGEKLDRFYINGEMPEEEKSVDQSLPVNAWEMHLAFNSNRSYITKYKKSEEKKGEVQRREQQNELIEERLKDMNYG